MLTVFLAAISLLFAADAGPARGKAQDKPQAKPDPFVRYLEQHELPGPLAELRGIGPHPEAAFMRLVDEDGVPTPVRARAMAALRNLPSPGVRAFVAKWVEVHAETAVPADRVVLRRAAMVLGWLGGPAIFNRLVLLFENEDPEVRLDAVLALGISRAPQASVILRKRAAKEPDARVRQQIQRVLLSLNATTGPSEDPPPRATRPIRTEF